MPLVLKKVVALFRHGDRTPVGSSFASEGPEEREKERAYWASQLPSMYDQRRLLKVMPVRCVRTASPDIGEERAHSEEDAAFLMTLFNWEKIASGNVSGLLTRRGCWDLERLGMGLRQRYVNDLNFLPELRGDGEVDGVDGPYPVLSTVPLASILHVRSTAFARTIQSAQHALVGLLSSELTQTCVAAMEGERAKQGVGKSTQARAATFHNSLPIYVRQSAFENLYMRSWRRHAMMDKNAKEAPQQLAEAMKRVAAAKSTGSELSTSDRVLSHIPSVEQLDQAVQALSGTKKVSWTHVADTLRCRARHNYPLPPSVTPTMLDQIIRLTTWKWMNLYSSTENCRHGIGGFFGEMMKRFDACVQGAKPIKLELVAAHDSTQIPLLQGFGVFDGQWPPYASLILIELWKEVEDDEPLYGSGALKSVEEEADQHYIRIIMNGREIKLPCALENGMHPYGAFRNATKHLVLEDPDEGHPAR